ncbi:RagB/SusD family nutrient uptake outer membrane protein [Puteibacter caeruleilacunae]|nr:RagB/SusD family nutrient uptake outer membrane protein [Puteibacter caeruleilacunae]
MKYLSIIFATMLLFACVSCEDLTEEPSTFYSEANIYKNEDGASMALTGVYGCLQKQMYPSVDKIGYGPTDEFVVDGWAQGWTKIMNLNFTAETGDIENYWKEAYKGINAANMFLDKMEAANFGTGSANVMIGEALFIRGLIYFNLVRLYGEVPLLLKGTNGNSDLYPGKASVSEIYEQVLTDLTTAKSLLPPADKVTQHPRFSKGSAQGMLTMVYATLAGYPNNKKEHWNDVKSTCEEMFSEEVHQLNPSYAKLFGDITDDRYDSEYHEILVQIAYSVGGEGSNVAAWGIGRVDRNVEQEGGAWSDHKPVPRFLKSYDVNDTRFKWNVEKRRNQNELDYNNAMIVKYKRRSAPDYHPYANPLNWVVMRYSDVLLLYAEALNEINNGPNQDACDAINKVRYRARPDDKKEDNTILPFLTTDLSYDSFKDAIVQERSWELCYEGIRWYDLKRWGTLVSTVQNIAQGDDGLPWCKASELISEKFLLYPIPQTEIDKNQNLRPQNAGY